MRIGTEAMAIFESLLEVRPQDRMAALASRCGDDEGLRDEVLRLLDRDADPGGPDLTTCAFGADFHLLRALDAASRPLQAFPTKVGRYIVHGEIGSGAMGIVYRAEQDQPCRMVALKLLLRGRDEALDMQVFRAEMQALAQVQHPGIVQIHDAGTVSIEGTSYPFLAMELVSGATLLEWDRRFRPDLTTRIRLLADLCAAVEAAHQRGVIHRDLKPDNIVVDTTGTEHRPRVLDFGIARLAHATEGILAGPGRLIVGTPAYMSPEQAAGIVDLDTRSDVYALGAIAHRLLSGREVVDAGSRPVEEVLRAVRELVPHPLSRFDKRLRGDLECVVAKALARDPDRRHPSARDLGIDLQNVLAHRPVSAREPSLPYLAGRLLRREPWKITAVACALVLVLVEFAQVVHGANVAQRDLAHFVQQSRRDIVRILDPLGRLAIAGPARREILAQMLPALESARGVHADDPELLQTIHDVQRLLGDILVDEGDHMAALVLRLRALATVDELLHLRPASRQLRAERATDLVRIGDIVAHQQGLQHARDHYLAAHEVYVARAAAAPGDEGALDDLAWSCFRMAQANLACDLPGESEALLAGLQECLATLEVLRPDSPRNHACWHALHCLRAHLADLRQDPQAALHHHEQAIVAARARFQHEPASRPAIIDLASTLISHVHRSGNSMDDRLAEAQLVEATRVLQGLLAQEESHRVGRKLLHWAGYVPRIRDAARIEDPAARSLLHAELYLEHGLAAASLLSDAEIGTQLDVVASLLDDVPEPTRSGPQHQRLEAALARARAGLPPRPR